MWTDLAFSKWNDWRWQTQNRVTDLASLEKLLKLTIEEKQAFHDATSYFRMGVTPYYASLMDPADPNCPIRRQVLPHPDEMIAYEGMLEDPLDEENHSPVPGLVHRYPDRALIYATHTCPVYCRHCTRKRKVGNPDSAPRQSQLSAAIDYIRDHEEIHDVLLSGGEPLSLADSVLDRLLEELTAIPHLDMVRIGTRNPVTLPQRITPELCEMLSKHRPIYVNTHFNHPTECTPESAEALNRLADAGCVLGNQMVLLKGINDDPETVFALNRWLLRNRCRPYYILHCDLAPGVAHFRTHTDAGVEIIKALRGRLSGLGIPHYVVDLPGGGGKIPLTPEYRQKVDEDGEYFQNYQGVDFYLPHPEEERGSS